MAKNNSPKVDVKVKDCPEDLKDHIFYGLTLDNEQTDFRDKIWSKDYDIVFCDAKAGTGKTLVAVATANLLCKYGRYDGIIYIVSPTQEMKIGYLPGSPDEKISPYITPLRDALLKLNINPDQAINQVSIQNQKEGTGYIDCVSHLYLRGVNFDNKIIIIDETQNMYLDELKKTLTRIIDTCKTIVIGHSGQCDLYKNADRSGFVYYKEWFSTMPRTAVCELTTNHRGWVSTHADAIDTEFVYRSLMKNKDNPDHIFDIRDAFQ